MEESYLTKLNYLAAAWPRVYNRINKQQAQVIKFQRKPERGRWGSPVFPFQRIYIYCMSVRICMRMSVSMTENSKYTVHS